ncbi:1-deoxy-D-xylulose-5-phosphate reductoisomerase [Candidatus Magnetomorum sp. HK-1]|nr:1-deoxy-D-xylulose-5-phosphate reductoisomerase [Candidatus Magnetomorum sp. HK-1]
MAEITPKKLTVLGSTGSIGQNTLAVVERFPERYQVEALAAGSNITQLSQQIKKFNPKCVCVLDEALASDLKKISSQPIEIVYGSKGYQYLAAYPTSDMVVSAIVGAAGLLPTLSAIEAGKDIALANKETLVMAGDIVMQAVAEKNIRMLPVDSEHSAIFQCLEGNRRQDFDHILLTASGGPFRKRNISTFAEIQPKHALNHPTWQMGHKISIDSSTLMNKGLEVIEAHFLFQVPETKIQVVVHPQSIIHSMVAYRDGSVIAQLGVPDMKGAIAYALSYPERLPLKQAVPDFFALKNLEFEKPDLNKFPCLSLAYEACKKGKTFPAVLNAANEIAVQAFLDHHIGFLDIPKLIEKALTVHTPQNSMDLPTILQADQWAREIVSGWIKDASH